MRHRADGWTDAWTGRRALALAVAAIVATAPGCGDSADATGDRRENGSAHYIAAEDGTRLAADVYLPEGAGPHPALLVITRYRRSLEDPDSGEPIPSLGPLDRHFLEHGYAIVKADARGSGASFGTRPTEYGPQEVHDGYAVVDWVVSQRWSDGNVGAYGTSYTGTTAELLAAVNHPALKAVIPGWSDFDAYVSPVRPYGLLASEFMGTWGRLVGWMDENDVAELGASVRRVTDDTDGSLLTAALREHSANPDVFEVASSADYKDDDAGGGSTWEDIGPLFYEDAIERSGVPMLVLVSWLDAGTADGTLRRFQHFTNPQKVVVLASIHGGGAHASPYVVGGEALPPQPSEREQFELRRHFFDHHLKGVDNGVNDWPPIRFFNMGEEAFHETEVWPPVGTAPRTLSLGQGRSLREVAGPPGRDAYEVDYGVTTGRNNRWMAQMGELILNLDDRGEMDARMLTFDTDPLPSSLQIAGTPFVTLIMSSDRPDGMILAYLEDVDPDGRSRYLTEGGLRLIHRKTLPDPYLATDVPYHSYRREDAAGMTPGAMTEVGFQLWPIAALIREGHRLRLAIAGADDGTFDRVPASGRTTITVEWGGEAGSTLTLPVVQGGLRP